MLCSIFGTGTVKELVMQKQAEMRAAQFDGKADPEQVSLWKRWHRALFPPPLTKNSVDVDAAKAVSTATYLSSLSHEPVRIIHTHLWYLCPLHTEHTPSFILFPDNHWHCFGCNRGRSVVDLCMEMENLKFIDACRRLLSL